MSFVFAILLTLGQERGRKKIFLAFRPALRLLSGIDIPHGQCGSSAPTSFKPCHRPLSSSRTTRSKRGYPPDRRDGDPWRPDCPTPPRPRCHRLRATRCHYSKAPDHAGHRIRRCGKPPGGGSRPGRLPPTSPTTDTRWGALTAQPARRYTGQFPEAAPRAARPVRPAANPIPPQ